MAGREVFRVSPALPAGMMSTYDLSAPAATHRRKASCQEVECEARRIGWTTTVDVSTVLGAQQANYIRLHSGRSFTVTEVGTMVAFTFYAGQECFAQHTVPLYRPPILTVRGGDWRGNPTGMHRVHTRPEDWIDDMQTTLGRVADQAERG